MKRTAKWRKPCFSYGIDSGGLLEEVLLSVAQLQNSTIQYVVHGPSVSPETPLLAETNTESANQHRY